MVLGATSLGVVVLALVAGFFMGRSMLQLSGPQIRDTATLLTRVQAQAQLVTVKYVFEKVIVLDDVKWYGQNRLLMIAHGIVKAGVDLRKVTAADVTVSADRIVLRLPRPQLLDTYLDESRTEVVERSTGVLRSFDQQMEQEARRQALESIRQAARASGILQDAEERTRLQLTSLAHSVGFGTIEVTFR